MLGHMILHTSYKSKRQAPWPSSTLFMNAAQRAPITAQNEANRLQKEMQIENHNVSLEQTMVAIQKAQIGFQATLHVRNRTVQAYTDIMNMQV